MKKWIAAFAMIGALVAAGFWQTPYGIPAWQVAYFALSTWTSWIRCGDEGCPAGLPEGFTEHRFQAEFSTIPVSIDVDARGRVYVAEGGRYDHGVEDNRSHSAIVDDDLASRSVEDRRAYLEKWAAAGEFGEPDHFTTHADLVTVYEDLDGDGVSDERRVLAEFRDTVDGLAAGVLAEDGRVYATVIPRVVRLREHASETETREVELEELATGFGVKSSLIGHDLHGLVLGPDRRLYFSVGDRGYAVVTREGQRLVPPMGPGRGAVFRMELDGSGLEVFATGLRNPQELAFDDYGNLFTGDNNGDGGDEARIVYVVEGGDTGWAMPFQTLVGDYRLGPWVEEKLWQTQHEGQPAWIVPPIGHLGRGPSGFAHYPGLGLPERYRGHFFLTDYAYLISQSHIWTFTVTPLGAGFELEAPEIFAEGVLATDVDFAWDGRMFVSRFDQVAGGKASLDAFEHSEARRDARLAEVQHAGQGGARDASLETLRGWLGHADRRVRLRAQWELARRGEVGLLANLARSAKAPELARIHALWGLAQLGWDALQTAEWRDLQWVRGESAELRTQAARIAGEAGAGFLEPSLLELLEDESARVRFFAAQSLGKVRAKGAVPALFEAVRANADRDAFLRHALVLALARIGELDAVMAHAGDADPAVRRASLLVLRRAGDPRIARFLADAEPTLVAEAARAIYDLPIPEAMPALAALAASSIPGEALGPQTHFAIHRRVIGANLALGDEAGALRLAAHAAREANPEPMRALALEALGAYTKPGPRDYSQGFWRPLPERPVERVYAALDLHGRALVEGDFGDRAMEIASAYGRVPLSDAELRARVDDATRPAVERASSLRALASRPGIDASSLLDRALRTDEPQLRAEARALLATHAPARAVAAIQSMPEDATVRERQRGYATLATLEDPGAGRLLAAALAELRAGTLPAALALDVLEASRQRVARDESPTLRALLGEVEAAASVAAAERHRWALAGGDPERGRQVFQARGDCQRCHGGAGHGGGVGPDLSGLAARSSAEERLRSVVDPGAEVVPGFGTVRIVRRNGEVVSGTLLSETPESIVVEQGGKRIEMARSVVESMAGPVSAMPPIALALEPRELRDLIAYLETL